MIKSDFQKSKKSPSLQRAEPCGRSSGETKTCSVTFGAFSVFEFVDR
jgi:hypothetical protein